jgi:predicted nuclease of restriction endonuclease-like (RecB) superfamily
LCSLTDYPQLLNELKTAVRRARIKVHRAVNTEMLSLYWTIGRAILDRQQRDGWGSKVVDRLAVDLRNEFPDMKGLARSNLKYMRAMAGCWTAEAIGQQAVGQLAWGHVTVLLDKLDDREARDWYAVQAAERGWTRAVLLNQIKSGLHRRIGAAPSNFPARLDEDSELVQQIVKDRTTSSSSDSRAR